MGIEYLDYLSQKIYFYYYGKRRHSSIIGGILTIIMIILCTTYILYFMINIANHHSSNFISYNKYVKDAGYLPFNNNEDGISHYFQFFHIGTNQLVNFNPKYIRIFMTRIYNGYKNNFKNLKDNEHWIYDKCRKGVDDKYFPEIVFNNESSIENCICLKYYYNNIDKKYYSIDNKEKFIFPSLDHGTNSKEFKPLNTIVEKCHNDSLFYDILGPCGEENEINNYFNNLGGIYMQLLQKQVEINNYSNPIFKYLEGISSSINENEVTINNINLAPFEIEIKTGVLYPKNKKTKTYSINYNKIETRENNNKIIVAVFNYWLDNTAIVFKGEYKSLYDVLPSVGGMLQLFYYIFFAFNFIINEYTIMEDSKNLFFQLKNHNNDVKEKTEKIKFLMTLKDIRGLIRNNQNNTQAKIKKSTNKLNKFSKTRINTNSISLKNQNRQSARVMSKFGKTSYKPNRRAIRLNNDDNISNNNINNISNNSNNNISNNNISNNSCISPLNINRGGNNTNCMNEINRIIKENKVEYMDYSAFSKNLIKFITEKRNSIKSTNYSKIDLKKYTSFYYYIIHLICRKTKEGKAFEIINKFRTKLLSEEHIFNTQIFLYYLEKYFDINESEKIDFTELYNYL